MELYGTEWPAWSLALALMVVVVSVYVGVRHTLGAISALWPIARRSIPSPVRWALRSLPVPRVRMVVAITSVAVASFLGTRWLQARGSSTPPLVPAPVTVPAHVDVPAPVSTSAPKPEPEPSAPFPATRMGRAAFVRTMVTVLQRKGLTHRQALLFAAHLARETGWGRWVRGNNFGNVKAGRGWTGPTFSMTDARGFADQYRAWPTLEQGVESTLTLVRNSARYRKAWKLLRAGDVRWYGQLGLDGYYEGPTGHARDGSRFHTEHDLSTVMGTQREYESIVALAAQYDAGAG